jgi:hypothetical protein
MQIKNNKYEKYHAQRIGVSESKERESTRSLKEIKLPCKENMFLVVNGAVQDI